MAKLHEEAQEMMDGLRMAAGAIGQKMAEIIRQYEESEVALSFAKTDIGVLTANLGEVKAERDKLFKDVATLTAERDALNQRAIGHEAKRIQHEAKLTEVDGRYAEYERRLAEYAEHPEVKAAAVAKRKQAALEAKARADAELAALEADDGTVSA